MIIWQLRGLSSILRKTLSFCRATVLDSVISPGVKENIFPATVTSHEPPPLKFWATLLRETFNTV